jgi:hypothetical protein
VKNRWAGDLQKKLHVFKSAKGPRRKQVMRLVKVRDCSSKMLDEETELAYLFTLLNGRVSGHLPKAVSGLCSIIQYSGCEAVVKMMKGKAE